MCDWDLDHEVGGKWFHVGLFMLGKVMVVVVVVIVYRYVTLI